MFKMDGDKTGGSMISIIGRKSMYGPRSVVAGFKPATTGVLHESNKCDWYNRASSILGILVIFGLFLLCETWPVAAEQIPPDPGTGEQVIRLKDKTIIRGRILDMANGTYRIKTRSMGEIRISADQILSIIADSEEPKAVAAPQIREGRHALPPVPVASGSLRRVRQPERSAVPGGVSHEQQEANTRLQSMMTDGNFGSKVTGLSETPQMQDVLSDPELMNAIQSGDYEALMNNEKMQNLMNSQAIKDLLGDIDR